MDVLATFPLDVFKIIFITLSHFVRFSIYGFINGMYGPKMEEERKVIKEENVGGMMHHKKATKSANFIFSTDFLHNQT